MPPATRPTPAARLRRSISRTAQQYAKEHRLPHYMTVDPQPSVMFHPLGGDRHGNFLPASYREIRGHHSWQLRLGKPFPRRDSLPEEKRDQARETDSVNSTDALLMNVFCHPFVARSPELAALFGQRQVRAVEFGFSPQVPLAEGGGDEGEVKLRFSDVLVEARLTEAEFGRKPMKSIERYRDFKAVFDPALLPQAGSDLLNAQLIRGILGAHALRLGFALICDARRPDLLRSFWEVAQAVKPSELRARCRFVLWQEIASAAPSDLREFLSKKYGIRG